MVGRAVQKDVIIVIGQGGQHLMQTIPGSLQLMEGDVKATMAEVGGQQIQVWVISAFDAAGRSVLPALVRPCALPFNLGFTRK